MRTSKSGAGRPADYTVREAACVLGVEPDRVARAIRLGTLPAVWRRGRFVVPARALARLLGGATSDDGSCSGDAP